MTVINMHAELFGLIIIAVIRKKSAVGFTKGNMHALTHTHRNVAVSTGVASAYKLWT